MNVSWHGIYPAATTHFHNDQSLDLPGTLKHLDAMLAAGIDGVIMLGTVGENCSLEYREKLDVLRATVEHVGRRQDQSPRERQHAIGRARAPARAQFFHLQPHGPHAERDRVHGDAIDQILPRLILQIAHQPRLEQSRIRRRR